MDPIYNSPFPALKIDGDIWNCDIYISGMIFYNIPVLES